MKRSCQSAPEIRRSGGNGLANYDCRFNKIEGDPLVIKWMLGFVIGGSNLDSF